MNNGRHDERALMGTLGTTSYISIGDPYLEVAKQRPRSSYLGKHFSVKPTIKGKPAMLDAMIGEDYRKDKFRGWSANDKWVDRVMFKDTQKRKPGVGFATGDWSKYDEFSNTIRTNQHREQLVREQKMAKGQVEKNKKNLEILLKELGIDPTENNGRVNLSKVGLRPKTAPVMRRKVLSAYEQQHAHEHSDHALYAKKAGLTSTPDNAKIPKDTNNHTWLSFERDYGSAKRTSDLIGYGAKVQKPDRPEYARVNIFEHTSFRKRGVPFQAFKSSGINHIGE
jgi:hypothetical protein